MLHDVWGYAAEWVDDCWTRPLAGFGTTRDVSRQRALALLDQVHGVTVPRAGVATSGRTVTIQICRDDRERTEGCRQGLRQPKAAALLGDMDGQVVGIRGDHVRKAVTRHIGQTHAPVRIAAAVDRCGPRERAIPASPEQPDGLGRPVVDQKVRVAIGVDVVQSNGVRIRRDVDAESRVVPVFPKSSVTWSVSWFATVRSASPSSSRSAVARSTGFSPAAQDHVTSKRRSPRRVNTKDALDAGNHEVELPVTIQIASLDRGGRASDNGVDPMERLSGGVSRWSGEGGGSKECETEGRP